MQRSILLSVPFIGKGKAATGRCFLYMTERGGLIRCYAPHPSGGYAAPPATPAVEPVGAVISHAFRPITEKAAHKGRLFQLSGGERVIQTAIQIHFRPSREFI